MSMTRYATLCQRCRIFVVRVPLLFGACRRVRIKGRRPRPRRAKSRLPWRLLSLSVPAITQWSRTRGPFDRSFSSIESSIKDAETILATALLDPPWSSSTSSSLSISLTTFLKICFIWEKSRYIYIYILFLEREICRLDGRKLKEFPEMLLSNFQDFKITLFWRDFGYKIYFVDSLWLKKFSETFLLSFYGTQERAWETISVSISFDFDRKLTPNPN